MLRKLLVLTTGVVFTWLAALPALAGGPPKQFEIQGTDAQRGDYSGTLRLQEQTDGSVRAERSVTFDRDGEQQVQRGVLQQRGEQLRGVLRENTGAAGRLEQREGESALLQVKVDEDAGTCEGACVGSRGVGSFEGQAQVEAPQAQPEPVAEPVAEPAPQDDAVEPDPAPEGPDADDDDVEPDDDDAPVVIDDALGEEPAAEPEPEVTQAPSGETFAGRPIYDYDPAIGITDVEGAYRVASDDRDWDGDSFKTNLAALMADPKLEDVKAIVLGYWGGDSSDYADVLLANKDKLNCLKALFVGDIDYEEAEISWIYNTDIGPLVEALPKLELLKVRGGNDLGFSGAFEHKRLKEIIIESGGTPASAVRELAQLELPALERLELWLGTDEYGGDATIEDVRPFLRGDKLPKLKELGLMNSDISDDIAVDAANAPILDQLEILDLSMGTLGDEGGRALIGSDKVKRLKTLNLDHHYMSDDVRDEVEALSPVRVIAGESMLDPDWPDDRYTAVGE